MNTQTSPKFLIAGGYGYNNYGDDAILRAALGSICRSFPEAKITLFSYNPGETSRRHTEKTLLSFERYLRKVFSPARNWQRIKERKYLELFRRNPIGPIMDELRDCDVFISLGGGYMNDYWGRVLGARLIEILVAKFLGKKVMLYAQGVGPFRNPFYKRLTRLVFDRVDVISVRDFTSAEVVCGLGVTRPRLMVTADEAFLLDPQKSGVIDEVVRQLRSQSNLLVGINVKTMREHFINHFRSGSVEEGMMSSAEIWRMYNDIGQVLAYLQKNYQAGFLFISMGGEDVKVARRILTTVPKLRNYVVLPDGFTPNQLVDAHHQVDVALTIRFHPLVFAITGGVPTVCLSCSPKTDDLMSLVGLGEYALPIESFTRGELQKKLEQIILNREELGPDLKRKAKLFRWLASQNVGLLEKVLLED